MNDGAVGKDGSVERRGNSSDRKGVDVVGQWRGSSDRWRVGHNRSTNMWDFFWLRGEAYTVVNMEDSCNGLP